MFVHRAEAAKQTLDRSLDRARGGRVEGQVPQGKAAGHGLERNI